MNKEQQGTLAILAATLIWGVSCFFYKNMLGMGWSVIAVAFVIKVFQLSGVTVMARMKKASLTKVKKEDRVLLAANGFFSFATTICFLLALNYTLVASAMFLQLLAPVWVAIFASLFMKEKMSHMTVWALLMAMLGAVLISNDGLALSSFMNEGFVWGLVSGVSYAGDLLTGRKLKHYSSEMLSFWSNFTPVLLMLPLLPFFWIVPEEALLLGVVYGVVYGLLKSVGTELYFMSLHYVAVSKVSILAMFDGVANAIVAFLLFAEIPTQLSLVGYVAIFVACLLLVRGGHVVHSKKLVPVSVGVE